MSKDMENAGVPAWLSSATAQFSPKAADHRDVPVAINLGEAFYEYLRVYYGRIVSSVNVYGGRVDFTYEGFVQYIETLIDSRVHHVMRDRTGGPAPRVHFRAKAAVPVLVEKALSAIGIVEIGEVGITFVPTFTPSVELLTASEFSIMTNQIKAATQNGFEMAPEAYDKNPAGALDMMSMQYMQDGLAGVYSHQKGSPAFAPLAFLFGLRQMQSLLGSRVFYADSVSLSHCLIELAAA